MNIRNIIIYNYMKRMLQKSQGHILLLFWLMKYSEPYNMSFIWNSDYMIYNYILWYFLYSFLLNVSFHGHHIIDTGRYLYSPSSNQLVQCYIYRSNSDWITCLNQIRELEKIYKTTTRTRDNYETYMDKVLQSTSSFFSRW